MISRGALAVFTWVVVELLLLGWAVSVLGGWNVLLLTLATAGIGAALIRRGVRAMFGAGFRPPGPGAGVERAPQGPVMARHAVLTFAGVLLLLPGLLSAGVGALLALPPIRAAAGSRLSSRITRFVVPVASPWGAAFGGPRRYGDVVDVDLVNEDITRTARGPERPSELR